MANIVQCANCGNEVPRPTSPNGRCPVCQAPLVPAPHEARAAGPQGHADGYEDLRLDAEDRSRPPPVARPPSRPGMAAAATPPAPPALRRAQSETSVAAARMASAPSFKAGKSKGGVPLVPILVGLVMIVAVAAFALLRGQPMAQTTAAVTPLDPSVTRIGRPPESSPLPQAEPDPAPPVVTRDLPGDPAAPPRERRKQPEREAAAAAPPAARAVRPPPAPAPAPAREVAKVEKPAPATPRPPPPTRPEPEPLPPPQFVASRQEMPSASAPLQIGPTYAREGQQKARLADPGCVKNSLRLPRDLVDIEGETATVKFAVDETGQVSQYAYLAGPSDPKVSNAIWAAIQRCPFIPGATSQGKPMALWVTMPIKFGK